MLGDWELTVATLAVYGSANRILPEAAERRVRAHADGFGKMSIVDLLELDVLYDWSHVRDSSPAGLGNVARAIRTELAELDLRRAVKFGGDPTDFESHETTIGRIVSKLGASNPPAALKS